jgi:hypothetical protein
MTEYDFFNDEFPDDERVPYKLIRWWFLGGAYRYCQHAYGENHGWHKHWADEYSGSYEQYESAFDHPLEKLMLEVLLLIMVSGRNAQYERFESYHRAKITAILEKNDLGEMLKMLQGDELNEFKYDLRLLKLM